jgi:hypothetical protein
MPSGKAWMTLANCKNRKYADAKGLFGLLVFSMHRFYRIFALNSRVLMLNG